MHQNFNQTLKCYRNYNLVTNDLFAAESKKIDDFDAYMFGLRPESNKRNPWFREYWHKLTGCPVNTQTRRNKADKRFCGKVKIYSVCFCLNI